MGQSRFDFKPLLERFSFGFSDRVGVNFGFDLAKFEANQMAKFDEFNLAFHVGDDYQKVLANRKKLALALGLDLKNLIFMNQIHSDKICVVDEKFLHDFHANFDENNPEIFPTCDALITSLRGVGLAVMVADCSPVILLDSKNGVLGVAHAGRAGVMQKILSKTAMKMNKIYGTQSADLAVFVGANIKGECYEIGDMDLGEFNVYKKGDKFDINLALKSEITALGIEKFYFSEICTHCDKRYFSYRRDSITGRFVGFGVIK